MAVPLSSTTARPRPAMRVDERLPTKVFVPQGSAPPRGPDSYLEIEPGAPVGLDDPHRQPRAGFACGPTVYVTPSPRLSGELFVHPPSAADINQGPIGDCYFEATLAAIAELDPERIKKLVTRHLTNGTWDGTYTVHLFQRLNGQLVPRDVQVDGRFPAGPFELFGSGEASRSACTTGALWSELTQKAYAKLRGSFPLTVNGEPRWAIEELTGEKAEYVSLRDGDVPKMLTSIRACLAAKKPVVASSRQDIDVEGPIMPNHAYSVLAVNEHDGQTFITVRNAYGRGTWGSDTGVFELRVADFVSRFEAYSLPMAR